MRRLLPLIAVIGALAQPLPGITQIIPDLSRSHVYVPADASSGLGVSHVRVPGLGNFDVKLNFNPRTLTYEVGSATVSQTSEATESLGGIYTCSLYNGTTPLFSTTIRPAGNDLVFGGALQYRFLGLTGTNVFKYTVSFSDGGIYLLSIIKESDSVVTAVTGYLAPGKTELDLSNTLKCSKRA